MIELKTMFEQRENVYHKLTAAIIDTIPNVVEGARLFIESRETMSREPEWKDVSMIDENGGYVVLVGILEYKIGDTLQLPTGATVEVKEETVEYFKRMLRIGIPYKMAMDGSKEEIRDYLIHTAEENDKEAEEAEQTLIEALTSQSEEDVDEAQFDMEGLTEEQQEQLRLFMLSNGGSTD